MLANIEMLSVVALLSVRLPGSTHLPVLFPHRIQAPGDPCASSITRLITLPNSVVSLRPYVRDQNFLVGLDLGRQQDHSALSVIERTYLETEYRDPVTFQPHTADLHRLVHLERFPLRTEYTEIGREVDRLFSYAPFSERANPRGGRHRCRRPLCRLT